MNGALPSPSSTLLPRKAALHALLAAAVASSGCTPFMAPREPLPVTAGGPPPTAPAPRELEMMTLDMYRIEPPDVLLINAIKVVPKPPHVIEPFDGLLIRAAGALPDQPIADAFAVDPEGQVDLGPSYGKVRVSGLTVDEAQDAIRRQLAEILEEPEVSVSLAFSTGAQQIAGEHLVGPDGRVNLGTYGQVYVAGMTIEESKEAIERQLSERLESPEVVVQVLAYNSKRFYVVTQGGGFGDSIVPQPITGNETVLDALAAIGGISQLSSTKMWIARPAPNGVDCEQILPIAYSDITRGASTATNYQLLPGDRLFIADDPLSRLNGTFDRITRPLERVFGLVSLGTATINRIDRFGLGSL
ncbi:MAG: polysaccharide biosynthesis/export family protein [Planctomycetota bacterium]